MKRKKYELLKPIMEFKALNPSDVRGRDFFKLLDDSLLDIYKVLNELRDILVELKKTS